MGVYARNSNELDSRYLFCWFRSIDLASFQDGTSVPRINKNNIAPLRIPVPSLADQRRIVAYLDNLQATVDSLKQLQEETAAELDACYLPSSTMRLKEAGNAMRGCGGDPAKTMSVKLTNQATGTFIIQHLAGVLGVNEKREVTLGFGTEFNTSIDILTSCVEFSKAVVDVQRRAIVRRAIIDSKKAGDVSANIILREIEKGEKAYLRRPIGRFVLLTSASFHHADKLYPTRLNGSVLTFTRGRPRSYPLPDGGSIAVTDNTPRDYTYVKVHMSARDPYEAAEVGFRQVDFLRAIWNLSFNLGANFRLSFGSERHKPVNRILPGPFHTLHFPDGKLALEGQWWYTPLLKGARAEQIAQRYNALREFDRLIRKRIDRCSFRDQLTGFLIRYVRALDEPDLTTSFLRLWALLEEITGTAKGSYDVTVRRASFVFEDPQYARVVLGYLRDQRNRIVHKGFQVDDAERLTYELKCFVEALLRFLLDQASKFANIQAFYCLLDLPPDATSLRARIKQHELAYKLHHR